MQRVKLPPRLKKAVTEFAAAHEKGRDASNAANRIKTELRNTIKSVWAELSLPIGSYIRTGGMELRYEANDTVSINNEPILKMLEDGEITREQFLRIFKVDAKEAKNILGADQVADLEVKTVGDKLDVRIDTLPVENHDDDYIAIASVVKKNLKRKVFGGWVRQHEPAKVKVTPRKIMIKGRK